MGAPKADDHDARARRERAVARRGIITVRSVPTDADDVEPTCGEAALSLVTQLTRMAWAMSGRTILHHDRNTMPYVFVPH